MATKLTTNCRCKAGNDMNCPYVLPFENLLAKPVRLVRTYTSDLDDRTVAVSVMTLLRDRSRFARGIFVGFRLLRSSSRCSRKTKNPL